MKKLGLLLIVITIANASCFANDYHNKIRRTKNVVLIAGAKSHGPGAHEYIKTVRLLKTMLDNSNVKNIRTEVHYNGWPDNEGVLESADLVLFVSDGRDGQLYADVPFATPERLQKMRRLMERGCGFSLIHFSTFASNELGNDVLAWGGGFFDWQDDSGKRNWYSSILNLDTTVEVNDHSPLSRGVKAFRINEEFYYNIRFDANDRRLQPVLQVPALKSEKPLGNCVAWTVQRKDGGRGFSTTMGHHYDNWKNDDFRKLVLNGIVWAAGLEVPQDGVKSKFYAYTDVLNHLYKTKSAALLLTGLHHPAHDWKQTTPLIASAVKGANVHVDISTNIQDLGQYDLNDYDFLILNYCNWNDSLGLNKDSKERFAKYVADGGGLMIVHFANGAFHYSLPGAASSDWPEFRNMCYRVWDHTSNSAHDDYQEFKVNIAQPDHRITEGMAHFNIKDELYFNQKGNADTLAPLLTATSKVTGKDEELAWAYNYGRGKVFQTLLGHSAESIAAPGMQQLLKSSARWLKKTK